METDSDQGRDLTFFTIIARNYLAQALVLGASLRRVYGDEAAFWIVVVDDREGGARALLEAKGHRFLGPNDLEIPEFRQMAFRYDVIELCTAVKPAAMLRLFEKGMKRVFYLDPDIEVYRRLSLAEAALEEAEVVLTPHSVTPHPDGVHPSDRFILQHGSFNLGFMGVRHGRETRRFLEWWNARLREGCRRAIDQGLFVDQKWMELAPAFLSCVKVIRDRGYNLAWWNLHERTLKDTDGDTKIVETDEPLTFIHFSGLPAAEEPLTAISKSLSGTGENGSAPPTLEERGDLRAHFTRYAEKLKESGHLEAVKRDSYAYGAYSDGSEILAGERQIYSGIPDSAERWPDPFQSGPGSFQDHCRRSGLGLKAATGKGLRHVVGFGVRTFRLLFGHRNLLRLRDYVRTESDALIGEKKR